MSMGGDRHITIKLRKANTPKREIWHLQVKMYNFLFWERYKILKLIGMRGKVSQLFMNIVTLFQIHSNIFNMELFCQNTGLYTSKVNYYSERGIIQFSFLTGTHKLFIF